MLNFSLSLHTQSTDGVQFEVISKASTSSGYEGKLSQILYTAP